MDRLERVTPIVSRKTLRKHCSTDDDTIVKAILCKTSELLAEYPGPYVDVERCLAVTMASSFGIWCELNGYIYILGEQPEDRSPFRAFMDRNSDRIRKRASSMIKAAVTRRSRKASDIEKAHAVIERYAKRHPAHPFLVGYQSRRVKITIPYGLRSVAQSGNQPDTCSGMPPYMVSFYISYKSVNAGKFAQEFEKSSSLIGNLGIPDCVLRFDGKNSSLPWQN